MRPLRELSESTARRLVGVFTDIDDTLSWRGKLVPEAFLAMSAAQEAGLRVVPITGRPGGWVDHLARMWPCDGVVGENGGLWFMMRDGRMVRGFLQGLDERRDNRARLDALAERILREVPGCALASDQPYRDLDLAIDFCEDVPRLDDTAIDAILAIFRSAGAVAKVSSIHVNGWFGTFDKLTGCQRFVRERWDEPLDPARWLYFGDSANDEPMFAAFPHAIGVANVVDFLPRMVSHPVYVTEGFGGHGFSEAIDHVLAARR